MANNFGLPHGNTQIMRDYAGYLTLRLIICQELLCIGKAGPTNGIHQRSGHAGLRE